MNEMDTLLDTEEQAMGTVDVVQLCKRHKEYKREIDKQRGRYEELQTTGIELRENRHILSKEVKDRENPALPSPSLPTHIRQQDTCTLYPTCAVPHSLCATAAAAAAAGTHSLKECPSFPHSD